MSVIVKASGGEYAVAPEGFFPFVCYKVNDLGIVETEWGAKRKIEIGFQLGEADPKTNKRYQVTKRYTASLHEKAALRKDLESWRGKKFTPEELDGFDVQKLIGVNGQAQIAHNIGTDGRTWANIQAIVRANGNANLTIENYGNEMPAGEADDNGPVPF